MHIDQRGEGPAADIVSVASPPIDTGMLAHLDQGLFRALVRLGTSRERICSAMCLSYAEYDYVSRALADGCAESHQASDPS